ncbi:hypothetical protein BHM03_00019793 [Ensete ventricosum]|nr:hypothetical protein BHM03_00019793 [Ensete ventricosum]
MLEAYDGDSDPIEHVAAFRAQMALYGTSDAIMCRVFLTTLQGIARGWYGRLPPSSIHSFNQLAREFEANFLISARPKPTAASLGMRQKEDEHLSRYLACFIEEIRVIPDAHPSLVIQAFMIEIKPSHLFWSLIREKWLLKTPNPMKSRHEDRDHGRYCCFHRDYKHNTEECYDLKNQIEDLIRRGHLDRYTRKPRESFLRPKGTVERQVDVLVGGLAMASDSSSARKAYTRAEVQKKP